MLEKELIEYMKEPGFQRCINLWIQQYKKYGKLGGSIYMENVSAIEKEQLGGFLGKDFREETNLRIRWKQWESALKASRYENASFFEVLKILSGGVLQTNKEVKEIEIQKEQDIFCQLLQCFSKSDAGRWLAWVVQQKDKDYQAFKKLLKQGELLLIQNVLTAINELPFRYNDKKLLPVFAATVTKSPHYFDKGIAATLLFHGICYVLQLPDKEYDLAERNKIMYDAGIVKDDLSNNCMIAHINAFQRLKTPHLGWYGFYENYEPWNLNLYNLQQISKIDHQTKRVYIVENPSVFRELVMFAKMYRNKECGYICSNGQLNLCTYVLLDMLKEEGIMMYYSGDFDPEGLLIADKLKDRYKDHFALWHYKPNDYLQAISNVKVSAKRLAIMENCMNEEIKCICDMIREYQVVGFQELLLDQYKKDIQNITFHS